MQPIQISVQFAASDDDGAAVDQTPAGAVNLTLNGVLVSSGVATLCSAGLARQVLVTTAANDSAKTITIYGTNATGNPISETITGPNATTGTTTKFFRTITRVAVSAAFTGNVRVGTNGVGASRVIGLDQYQNPFNVGLGCTTSGTVNYTVQHTFDDLQSSTEPTWFDHTSLVGDTSNGDVRGIRLRMNSGTGTVTFTVLQSSQKAA
jgi:hypothetical protein